MFTTKLHSYTRSATSICCTLVLTFSLLLTAGVVPFSEAPEEREKAKDRGTGEEKRWKLEKTTRRTGATACRRVSGAFKEFLKQ